MEIPNYPSNRNHPDKPEETPKRPAMEKVVEGTVVERKPSFGTRLTHAIFAENVNDVGEYLFWDLAIPFIKNALIDAISEGANRMFNGSPRSTSTNPQARRASRVNYASYSRMSSNQPERRPGPASDAARYHDQDEIMFQEIQLATRGDAERVLFILIERLEKYGVVTRSELLQTLGRTPSFTDEKWGWVDLNSARVIRARSGGYKIDLPDAVEI